MCVQVCAGVGCVQVCVCKSRSMCAEVSTGVGVFGCRCVQMHMHMCVYRQVCRGMCTKVHAGVSGPGNRPQGTGLNPGDALS